MDKRMIEGESFEQRPCQLIKAEESFKRFTSQGCPMKVFIRTPTVACGTVVIPPKKRLGRATAHGSEEVYYQLRGTCKVELPRYNQVIELRPGDVLYIPSGTIHSPFNDSDEDMELLFVCMGEWP